MKKLFLFTILTVFSLCCNVYGQNKHYYGAELSSKKVFKYGRFEVRMKPALGSGIVSSFFIFNDSAYTTNWNEIDIEFLGCFKDFIHLNAPLYENDNSLAINKYTSFIPSAAFHVYTIEWTPDYIAWFVDSNQIYKYNGTKIGLFNKHQNIKMNIWTPTPKTWAGQLNDSILSDSAQYNWVKFYSYNDTTRNFKLEWTDEFDSLDTTRWEKSKIDNLANSYTNIVPKNCFIQNGKMILKLGELPDIINPIENKFNLFQIYPNPFNQLSVISYQLSEKEFVKLSIYDLMGKEVTTLVNEINTPGNYEVLFDASGLNAGVYFCQFRAGKYISTKKMILIK